MRITVDIEVNPFIAYRINPKNPIPNGLESVQLFDRQGRFYGRLEAIHPPSNLHCNCGKEKAFYCPVCDNDE